MRLTGSSNRKESGDIVKMLCESVMPDLDSNQD